MSLLSDRYVKQFVAEKRIPTFRAEPVEVGRIVIGYRGTWGNQPPCGHQHPTRDDATECAMRRWQSHRA